MLGRVQNRVSKQAFSGVSDSFRVTPFRGGAISQILAGEFVPTDVLLRSNASGDLGPHYAEGACAEWVATAGFRQTRACAGARRVRARIIFLFFIIN